MRRFLCGAILCFLLTGIHQLNAQNPNNGLLYSNQATLFGQNSTSGDPISVVMPGTAFHSGFGSFIDNPASSALGDISYVQFGLSHRNINEDAIYLGQSRLAEATGNGMTNAGFVYKYPTVRGSLVIGAGYTQNNIFNRTLEFRGRNENNSITDAFKVRIPHYPDYREVAYETYSIDFLSDPDLCSRNTAGNFTGSGCESIFRIDDEQLGDFFGISQQGNIIQNGVSGEYSLFFATEVQENLFLGASAGLLSGTFRFKRVFQELDEDDIYNGTVIDSNQDGFYDTHVDNLAMDEDLKSSFSGFRARAGFLYKVSEQFNIGASYTFPTIIEVDEVYDISLSNTFDNGDQFDDSAGSEFAYKIKSPPVLTLGVGMNKLSGFSVSLSAEHVNYSKTSVDFIESDFFDDEITENDFLSDNFVSVWSYRGGMSYDISHNFSVMAGYSFMPSRFKNGDDDRQIFSGGLGFSISDNIRFEAAAQFTTWDETSSVYDYVEYDYSVLPDDAPEGQFRSQEAIRSIDRLQLFGTLKFKM